MQAGANPNAENHEHVTALNAACYDKHEECALLLLHAGANADVKDAWGDTPKTIAQKNKMANVLAVMQGHTSVHSLLKG